MENQQIFKINRGFTSEEAGNVLTTLINSKIDYHNLEDFSSHIRFNNAFLIKKRLLELNETKEEIKKLLKVAEERVKFSYKSTIEISFEE
jgi:hypothetical protein